MNIIEVRKENKEEVNIEVEEIEKDTRIEEDEVMNNHIEQKIVDFIDNDKENESSIPKRKNAEANVEKLELGHGSKVYISVKSKKFLCVKGCRIGAPERGANESFMSVAADVLFTQVGKFLQMIAKAGIKRFCDGVVAAMTKEFKQLND